MDGTGIKERHHAEGQGLSNFFSKKGSLGKTDSSFCFFTVEYPTSMKEWKMHTHTHTHTYTLPSIH